MFTLELEDFADSSFAEELEDLSLEEELAAAFSEELDTAFSLELEDSAVSSFLEELDAAFSEELEDFALDEELASSFTEELDTLPESFLEELEDLTLEEEHATAFSEELDLASSPWSSMSSEFVSEDSMMLYVEALSSSPQATNAKADIATMAEIKWTLLNVFMDILFFGKLAKKRPKARPTSQHPFKYEKNEFYNRLDRVLNFAPKS